MQAITLKVSGMKCGGCSSSIKQKLESIEGVLCAKADHKAGTVEIEFDSQKANVAVCKTMITESGFTVES